MKKLMLMAVVVAMTAVGAQAQILDTNQCAEITVSNRVPALLLTNLSARVPMALTVQWISGDAVEWVHCGTNAAAYSSNKVPYRVSSAVPFISFGPATPVAGNVFGWCPGTSGFTSSVVRVFREMRKQ